MKVGDRVKYNAERTAGKPDYQWTDDHRNLEGVVIQLDADGDPRVKFDTKSSKSADGAYGVMAFNVRVIPEPDTSAAKVSRVPHNGKDDSTKPDPLLWMRGVAGALREVGKVLDGGAKKYAADSWKQVPNGQARYLKAAARHWEEIMIDGPRSVNTADFGLLNIDHLITDLLFIRQLMLDEDKANAA